MKAAVIGAGLAGAEAAWQLKQHGISVDLYEMKPEKRSPAHKSDNFAELVCSNSLKAERRNSAAGLLKAEMARFGSICMESAMQSRVPAGGALAVDRDLFSGYITEKLKNDADIHMIYKEVTALPTDADAVILAAGRWRVTAYRKRFVHSAARGCHFTTRRHRLSRRKAWICPWRSRSRAMTAAVRTITSTAR